MVPGAFYAAPDNGGLEQVHAAARGMVDDKRPIKLKHLGGRKLLDFVWSGIEPLIHTRVIKLMTGAGITGWRTYPIQLLDRKGVAVPEYHGLAIIGRSRSITVNKDPANVVYETNERGRFPRWKGLNIDLESWDGSDLFRSADQNIGWIVATAKVKALFEKARISNCMFTPVDDVRMVAYGDDAPQSTLFETPSAGEHIRRSGASEAPVSSEALTELGSLIAAGARRLDLAVDAPPRAIVAAIHDRVEKVRPVVGDTAVEYALELGCLWGEQVRRTLGWQWAELTISREDVYGIVSPDRAFVVLPNLFIKQLLEDDERDNTTQLLFEMIHAGNVPAADPGAYVVLS